MFKYDFFMNMKSIVYNNIILFLYIICKTTVYVYRNISTIYRANDRSIEKSESATTYFFNDVISLN